MRDFGASHTHSCIILHSMSVPVQFSAASFSMSQINSKNQPLAKGSVAAIGSVSELGAVHNSTTDLKLYSLKHPSKASILLAQRHAPTRLCEFNHLTSPSVPFLLLNLHLVLPYSNFHVRDCLFKSTWELTISVVIA